LRKLLAERLKHYQLSATHVNQFTDVTSGGAQAFLLDCLLRFPKAKTAGAHYGTAVHETIRWFFQEARRPSSERVLSYFEDRLSQQRLAPQEHQLFTERGRLSLSAWLAQRGQDASSDNRHELNFRNEASFIGDAHLSGKIDRLSIDRKKRTIILTDFKTGQPYSRWAGNSIRLHKYRQQLLIYKLLVERSRLFRGYKVEKALLEFVEPDEYGQIVQLELAYEEPELEEMKKLLISIWRHVQDLDFPQPDTYAPTIAGIKAFEKQLTAEPK
jgi:DNA helicase-2/ATP-dependent DNA helicase PcrA